MSKRKRLIRFLQISLLFAAAGGVWWYENVYTPLPDKPGDQAEAVSAEPKDLSPPTGAERPATTGTTGEKAKPSTTSQSKPKTQPRAEPVARAEREAVGTEKVNGYDRLLGTVLVGHRNNDGDSFFVRHGDRQFELRLYYADSPEKYLSDRYEDQRKRVAEQARELGGLSIDETVALGQEAKAHVLSLLEGQSFSVFTKWERVYDGERYYGFVLLPGGTDWLCENLVGNGLARIHTKGEMTPDGKGYRDFKRHLESLEAQARSAKRGAWR